MSPPSRTGLLGTSIKEVGITSIFCDRGRSVPRNLAQEKFRFFSAHRLQIPLCAWLTAWAEPLYNFKLENTTLVELPLNSFFLRIRGRGY
jgi:hypothetical protein